MKVLITDIGVCEFDFTKMHIVKGKKDLISTRCKATIPNMSSLFYGHAHQNPSDKYSKLIGKKLALTRVLSIIWPESMIIKPLKESEISHHKKLRQLIWIGFWKEFDHLLEKV